MYDLATSACVTCVRAASAGLNLLDVLGSSSFAATSFRRKPTLGNLGVVVSLEAQKNASDANLLLNW